MQDVARGDVQRAGQALRDATKAFEEAQASGDQGRVQAAKREMERRFGEFVDAERK